MGDRAMAEIKTEDGSLYFYTHWAGHDLPNLASAALAKANARRGDTVYATRIVVDQLINLVGARDSETGAGIMLAPNCEDEYNADSPSVVIDLVSWEVSTAGR